MFYVMNIINLNNNLNNSYGIYDITSYNLKSNNATILSTLNISGTITLNNVFVIGSLNFSSSTTFSNNTAINGTCIRSNNFK